MLTNIYQLNLLVNGKVVQFSMNAEETLKPIHKIDNEIADKWRNRLQAIASTVFEENDNGKT